jgi:hypothetical protein
MELFTATEKLKFSFWQLETFDIFTTGHTAPVEDTSSTPTLVAANWHNMHAIYQVSFV